ncbi:MAG: glycosyltransferase [Vicinamibacterales bacterium]
MTPITPLAPTAPGARFGPSWRWVVFGLSITSSWGNGHATTYRGLLRELAARGHDVTFLECDAPWYAAHRDVAPTGGVRTELYVSLGDVEARFGGLIRGADVVIVGSYVPEGAALAEWILANAAGVKAFYDIDTPVTLAALESGAGCEYLGRHQVSEFDAYFSFAGGRTLERLAALGAKRPHPLYCSVDPLAHSPVDAEARWDLGYLGTYSHDRQPALDQLMLSVARSQTTARFVVAGPLYPSTIEWPANVERFDHVAPPAHASFYARQRYTLNVTRADMRALGHAPSVRLFEAAACGTAIISDTWEGLGEFFTPGIDILEASTGADVEAYLRDISDARRAEIGAGAQRRVLAAHTSAHRAAELEAQVATIVSPEASRLAAARRTTQTTT